MKYSSKLFADFIINLVAFDKDCKSTITKADLQIKDQLDLEKKEYNNIKNTLEVRLQPFVEESSSIIKSFNLQVEQILDEDIESKKVDFDRLQSNKEALTIINGLQSSLTGYADSSEVVRKALNKDKYNSPANTTSLEQLLSLGYDVDIAFKNGDMRQLAVKSVDLHNFCCARKEKINSNISKFRSSIIANIEELHASYQKKQSEFEKNLDSEWQNTLSALDYITNELSQNIKKSTTETQKIVDSIQGMKIAKLNKLADGFCQKFPPKDFADEHLRIYSLEPNFDNYSCATEMPKSVYIGAMEYDTSHLDLCDYTKEFLNRYYYFTYRDQKLLFPYCEQFGSNFNYLFSFNGEERELVAKYARDIGMRLFMRLPPGKINFTFFDPITLGGTFASFTRLVEVDDRTRKVINGKIWTSAEDIEDKLKIATDHIANVTQRCLQGQYENIQEYNVAAGQNAEPYQVIMVMDFPAGFNETSLKLLEQIVSTGPKCGVYTILMKSAEQYAKADEKKFVPLINNIMNNICKFVAVGDAIAFDNISYKDKKITFNIPESLSSDELNKVIPILKSGIKNAEKIVIGFDKIIPPKSDWFKGDCSSELSIPIGVHGANNIQNLTFGIGGSHHALVAGQTGAGKSSLLHTIIMSALIKYPSNQLQIFLVDFKRGVEFKIYANYALENFKVIAIESEREFGCSVLEYLDKEQSRRADKFKRYNVDNLEDYRERAGETLPRIMLIVDEFHVLFSKDATDINSKNSAAYLEQIIRQGRAFGVHVILASQTMSNIGGISHGVWGQVGVRIALKCPKSDAKFVLGNDNDGVDLLSADNPGQAIYNSDCGNKIANTVFRVAYVDQEEQDKYLKYISKNEPRYDYSATRVMLSNVEDNIYNPLQRFKQGENIEFNDNAILVGEPLKLVNNMHMTFKAKQSSNMLVIGNDEQKARNLFTFAAISLALHKLTVNGYSKPNKRNIYLFDYAPMEDFYDKDVLVELSKMLPSYIKYIPFDEADEAMDELYQDFTRREKGENAKDETYLFVYGLQRARNLRSNDIYKKTSRFEDFDEFGGDTVKENLTVKPYDMFLNILQRGAMVGINALIWEDNYKLFMNSYSDMLPNFDMRVAFTMPDEDSINFIEEVDGSKIGENGAIYNYNGNHKFRPYKKPDLEWLKNICNRLENFKSKEN